MINIVEMTLLNLLLLMQKYYVIKFCNFSLFLSSVHPKLKYKDESLHHTNQNAPLQQQII